MFDNYEVVQPGQFTHIWWGTGMDQYYPLTLSAFWAQYRLFGQETTGYHMVNMLLHGLAGLLLWRCLRRLKVPGAWVAAAIFVVHPVNVPSVTWIAELKNVLSGCLFFAAVLAFLHHLESRRWSFYALSLLLFAAALLSKSSTVVLGPVLAGVIWWRQGSPWRREILKTAPYFVMAAAMGLVTVWFERHHGSSTIPFDYISPAGRLAAAGWAVWFYLGKIIAPIHLSLIYPQWHVDDGAVLSYVPLALLLTVAAAAVVWRRNWGKYVLAVGGYMVVAPVPVLGFVNISYMHYARVADHWLYLPLAGVLGGLAAAGTWAARRLLKPPIARPTLAVAAGVVLAVMVMLTRSRQEVFLTQDVLWSDIIQHNPDCWLAQYNLGVNRGHEGRLPEAMELYQKTLSLCPRHAEALHNMGLVEQRRGRLQEARKLYIRSLEIDPRNPMCHNSMGSLLAKLGQQEQAGPEFKLAVELDGAMWKAGTIWAGGTSCGASSTRRCGVTGRRRRWTGRTMPLRFSWCACCATWGGWRSR